MSNFQTIISDLRKKKLLVSIPVKIKFKLKNKKKYREVDAKQFTYVIKWKDILKVFRNNK
jgi:hypothetical protein